jgi:hypothetical protein
MAKPTLFELFGETSIAALASRWPAIAQPGAGLQVTQPALQTWLAALNNGVGVGNVRTGAADGRIGLEAELTLDNAATGYAGQGGFPFALGTMPNVLFRIQSVKSPAAVRLLASASAKGVEILLEGLPVEIRLPAGLVERHPSDTSAADVVDGDFTPGDLDDLMVVYRRSGECSVFVHVRLHIDEDGDVAVLPAVPLSFGESTFSGLPCRAIHDLGFFPAPAKADRRHGWLRHSVTPWTPRLDSPVDGLVYVRSLELDTSVEPLSKLADGTRRNADVEPTAEFVLDDLVLPLVTTTGVPLPRHITVGVRRRALDSLVDPKPAYKFTQAPFVRAASRAPGFGLIVESFFFRSLPAAQGLGLSFAAAFYRDEEKSDPAAFSFGLGENVTPRFGYRREFDAATGLPKPGPAGVQKLNTLLHLEIGGALIIDLMGFSVGYSLGRALAPPDPSGRRASFGECAEATADLFVSMPPTGGQSSWLKLRALDGERVAFGLERIGWRQGSFHLEGVALPDGVVFLFADTFELVIQELGLVAERGASYVSFSGGVGLVLARAEVALFVRRLRVRAAGSRSAPPIMLEGFFFRARFGDTARLEAGGYYSDITLPGPPQQRVQELAMTGLLGFELGEDEWLVGFDQLTGHVEPPRFEYWLLQCFFKGAISPIWSFELRGARVLFASGMRPKVAAADGDARELRYYNWFKGSNPLTVPGPRRLAAWQTSPGAVSVGLGAAASIAAFGRVFNVGLFVLVVVAEDEKAVLVVGGVQLLQNVESIGFLAAELDVREGRFSAVVGVEVKASQLELGAASTVLDQVGRLTGTLFLGNKPATFAIGRLSDRRTWLQASLDVDIVVERYYFLAAFGLELVDGGPKGLGFVLRVEARLGVSKLIALELYAEAGVLIVTFQTASSDYAAAVWLDAALRFVVFGFLRLGVGLGTEARLVGIKPARWELRAEVRLETPWYLPKVTWSFERVGGDLEPRKLGTSSSPLRSSSALEGRSQKQGVVHVERADSAWDGQGPSSPLSLDQLSAATSTEADRLARLAADTAARPVATDSTVAIEWSVPVNDKLGLGGGVAAGLGDQRSGDLKLTYDLVGIAVRRRERFGASRPWKALEDHVELGADFSSPGGVGLSGSFSAHQLSKVWDPGLRVDGHPAAKKLLLNASTPFEFQTRDPEADEELVRSNPNWPCCDGTGMSARLHASELGFRAELPGTPLAEPRAFADSNSRLTFLVEAAAAPQGIDPALALSTVVAVASLKPPRMVLRADFDEDVAFVGLRVASGLGLTIVGYDAAGAVAGTTTVAASATFHSVALTAQGPMRRLEVLAAAGPFGLGTAAGPQASLVLVDRVAYVGLRAWLDELVHEHACDRTRQDLAEAYSGRGKVSFLPNHEYEVALTTRVTVTHPSAGSESASVKEYVLFTTKGLPGLNATDHVGAEIAPYVRSRYTGGRGVLYREEPVALTFSEDFHVAVPLTLRSPGGADERATLLRMTLLVQPDVATGNETPFTATADDWIVAHRSVPATLEETPAWNATLSEGKALGAGASSDDTFRQRLAKLTQRASSTCNLADPRDVIGTTLVAPPQGEPDPSNTARQLWPGGVRVRASVRPEGAGFVARERFDAADVSAFDFALDAAADSSWSVTSGQLVAPGGAARRFASFGEDTWNHLELEVLARLTGDGFGIGVALPARTSGGGTIPSRGLFAVVEKSGSARRLALYRRSSGTAFDLLAQAALPVPEDAAAPVSLRVTAFDDRLRASTGEATIEADRGELRNGRLCLLAQGGAAFGTLDVRGLELYGFSVPISRFASFRQHVESFSGHVGRTVPNMLGAATTVTTVAALWQATRAQADAVMKPEAQDTARHGLFERWLHELGLPVRDDATRLELTRFEEGGKTTLVLLEGPEPLDFTEEVSATMSWRRPAASGDGGLSLTGPALKTGQRPVARERPGLLREDVHLPKGPGPPPEPVAEALEGAVADRRLSITGVERAGEGLTLSLDQDLLSGTPPAPGELVCVERTDDASGPHLRFYSGSVELGSAGAMVRAAPSDDLEVRSGSISSIVSEQLALMKSGTVVVLEAATGAVVGSVSLSTYVEEAIAVRLIQDAGARRALLIPVSGSSAITLDGGDYRLTLSLSRKRWSTTEAPDSINTYSDKATLALRL